MRITLPPPPVNYNNINFTSKVKKVMYGSVPEDLKDKVDMFEETDRKNAEKVGHGLQAYAYRFPDTTCVIKESKPGKAKVVNGDFGKEAQSLMLVPEEFEHCQKLIGNVQTEDGNWYLLTTFVGGKIPDGKDVKWTKESLHSLLDTLAGLDTEHVYHGDVSRCNCLITEDDEVNLLDFQYAEKFDFKGDDIHRFNADRYKVPYFIAPSNLQMFEESNFATYLSTIDGDEARELFKEYLKEKSTYHQKRAEAFEKQGARPEIVEYETLMAKYLKEPSVYIVDLEAQKMQILLTHRYLLSSLDGHDNIMGAVPYYLDMIDKSNQMAKMARYISAGVKDEEYKKLLDYMEKDALFWKSQMKNELDGRHGKSSAFRWILRNARQCPENEWDNASQKFIKTQDIPYKKVPDIHKILTDECDRIGFDCGMEDEISAWMREKLKEMRKTQTFFVSKKSDSYEPVVKFHEAKKEVMQSIKQMLEMYQQGANYDSMFYSLESLYGSVSLKDKAQELSMNPKLSYDERSKMRKEAGFFEDYSNNLFELNERMYKEFFERASDSFYY